MPRYSITVKPGSSQEKIVEAGAAVEDNTAGMSSVAADVDVDGSLIVYLRAKPHDGEANAALIKLLAKHFKIGKTAIKILRGVKSRQKLIEF